MPCWFYDKSELKDTPSADDHIDYERECRYRREGARLIIDIGTKMDLGYNTIATGVVYFHRFYMFHSFKAFPRYVTACGCLFLSGKVEETPKRCNDIIKTANMLLSEKDFATFGTDPKNEMMTLEKIILQTIKFDLEVEHPHKYIIIYGKEIKCDKVVVQQLVQMAWTFANDSLCSTLCLQWEAEVLAMALMFLASKINKIDIMGWIHENFDVTTELLDDICHQVLDVYQHTTKMKPSPKPKTAVSVTARATSNHLPSIQVPPIVPPLPVADVPIILPDMSVPPPSMMPSFTNNYFVPITNSQWVSGGSNQFQSFMQPPYATFMSGQLTSY